MEKIEYVISNKDHTKFLVKERLAYYSTSYHVQPAAIDEAVTFKSKEDATNTLLRYFENRSGFDENIDDFEILQIKKTVNIVETHNSYDYTKPIKWHYPFDPYGREVKKKWIQCHLNSRGLHHDFDWVETKRTKNYAYLTIKFKN